MGQSLKNLIMNKVINIVYYVVLGFVGLIVGLLLVSVFPITGNIQFLMVESGSMEPALKMGGIVMVKPVDDYKIGEIITFKAGGKEKITHRIEDIKVVGGNPLYITKGDANNAPDRKEIKKSEVVGKVFFHIPYLGYAVDFVQKPIGFALLIIIPAGVIIGGEVKKIVYEVKKKKEEN